MSVGVLGATSQLHSYNVTNTISTTNTSNARVLLPAPVVVVVVVVVAVVEHGILGLKSLQ